MIVIKPEDVLHKAQLLRLLSDIIDNPILSSSVYFKGGTCASMLGLLDRFSIDLDFDLKAGSAKSELLTEFGKIFKKGNYKLENSDKNNLYFVLKYDAPENQRNTLKLSVSDALVKANDYKTVYLSEIDRFVACQTIETMFANKLVAPVDRFKKHEKIAGRDIYDIHYFFSKGYRYKKEIIQERTKLSFENHIKALIKFIDIRATDKIIDEDLNMLLPYDKYLAVRKTLKPETLIFLRSIIGKLA